MDISNKHEFVNPEKFAGKSNRWKKTNKNLMQDYQDLDFKYPDESYINLDENYKNEKRNDIKSNSFFNEYFDDYKEKDYHFYREYDRGKYLPEAVEYFDRKKGKLDGNDYLYKIGNNNNANNNVNNDNAIKNYSNDDEKPVLEGGNFLNVKDGITNSKGRTVQPGNYYYDVENEPSKIIDKTEKVNEYVNLFYLEPFERVVNINNNEKKIIKKKKPKIPDFFKE